MTSSSDWAIEAHALVKTFGSNRAVDGVDLSMRVFAPLTVRAHMRKA